MSIELEPSELEFQRPFTREVTQTLRIKNTNYEPVAFKVKTTAPKQYCVRPNSGRIEAGKEVEVQVLLQQMKKDPPPDFKCRDKFLVQSILITADREAENVQQIWSQVEKSAKSAIQEKKIRVVYRQPGETTNGVKHEDVSFENSPYSGDADSIPASAQPLVDAPTQYAGGDNASNTSGDKDSELAGAKAKIARLEAELKQAGLRARKTAGAAADAVADRTAGMGMTTHPPEGIPVQICAALCLAAFFIAWFFF